MVLVLEGRCTHSLFTWSSCQPTARREPLTGEAALKCTPDLALSLDRRAPRSSTSSTRTLGCCTWTASWWVRPSRQQAGAARGRGPREGQAHDGRRGACYIEWLAAPDVRHALHSFHGAHAAPLFLPPTARSLCVCLSVYLSAGEQCAVSPQLRLHPSDAVRGQRPPGRAGGHAVPGEDAWEACGRLGWGGWVGQWADEPDQRPLRAVARQHSVTLHATVHMISTGWRQAHRLRAPTA